VFHLPNTAVTGAFTLDQLPDFAFEVVGDHLPTEIFVLRSVSERFAKCPTIGSAEGLYGNGEFGGRVSYVYGSEPPPLHERYPSLVHDTALEAIALLRRVVDSPGDGDEPYYIWSGVMDGLWDKYGLGDRFGPIADIDNSDQDQEQAYDAFEAKFKEEQLASLDEVEAEVRAKGVSVPGILLRALKKHKGGPLDGILWKWWDGSEEFPKMCMKHYIEITVNQVTCQFDLRPVVRVTRPGGKVRAPPCSAAPPPRTLNLPLQVLDIVDNCDKCGKARSTCARFECAFKYCGEAEGTWCRECQTVGRCVSCGKQGYVMKRLPLLLLC